VMFVLAFIGLGYLTYNPPLLEDNGEPSYSPPKLASDPHYVIGQLRFCSDPWPPYAGKADVENRGYVVEIIQEIYEGLGYVVLYENVPWSRCLRDTRDGIFNGVAGADINEAPDFIFPRSSVGITNPQFFTRPDSQWLYHGVQSLDDIRLGVVQDYTYSPVLDIYIRQHQSDRRLTFVKGTDALTQLFNLVKADRIDAFVENATVVEYTLSQLGVEQGKIKPAGSLETGVILYVPFSPRYQESRELISIFDSGMEQLRNSGRLKEILAKYQVKDWLYQADQIKKRNLKVGRTQ